MHRRPSDDASSDWAGGLYDRLAAGLYRYALMILASTDDAADVVQDVFSVLRRRRRDAPCMSDAPLLEAIAAADDRPYERLAIEQAIRALPPEQREVVHLKVFCGMTFQEVAAVVDESINTVASRYRYAIEKLRTAGRPVPRWAWVPAAAAAAVAVLLYSLAAGARADLTMALTQAESVPLAYAARENVLRELAASLGDGVRARDEADWILTFDEEQAREDRASMDESRPDAGGPWGSWGPRGPREPRGPW